jgi:hypothetical protein
MSESLLDRYNAAYNLECAALPSGGPISMEHLQAMALECLLKATDKSRDWDIPYEDVVELIEALYKQGNRNG